MSTKDIILCSAPFAVVFLLSLGFRARSVRLFPLAGWQLLLFLAVGLAIVVYGFLLPTVGPGRYIGLVLLGIWLGTETVGWLWHKRKRSG
jgi:hypothetical protein